MKMKRIFSALIGFVFICTIAISSASCTKITAADLMADITPSEVSGKAVDEAFTSAELEFALSLFKETVKADQNKNLLISPLSVALALSVAANGAGGETLAEMENALGMSIDDMNAYLHTYISALPNEEKCKLKTANSFWFRNDGSITVNKPFLQKTADYHDVQVYSAPFDATTVRDMNKWVKDNTDGLIDEIAKSIDAETVMYIINALVFEAEWANMYDRSEISKGKFTSAGGAERDVKYMHTHESNCFYKEDATGFIKYYSGSKYAFVAAMPTEGDVYAYAQGMTAEKYKELFEFPESGNDRYAEVYLPKFKYEYSVDMEGLLCALGIKTAFEQGADFSGIGETSTGILYIDEVHHKTFISVDECGTKAGAVTAIKGGCGSAAPGEEIHFDRPFIYFIVDMNTKLPVFMGIAADIGE